MKRRQIITAALTAMLAVATFGTEARAQEVSLPIPKSSKVEGSLIKALEDRRSTRTFTDKAVSDQTLSELLWAANGINRADGRRTAPSARNKQDVTIYVGKADGTYRYEPKGHKLVKIGSGDLRKAVSGRNTFIQTAPMVLLLASDTSLMGGNMALSGIDVGTVVQNVYLFCAANGLGTVCCYAGENTDDVQKFIGVGKELKPLVYMPVGY